MFSNYYLLNFNPLFLEKIPGDKSVKKKSNSLYSCDEVLAELILILGEGEL